MKKCTRGLLALAAFALLLSFLPVSAKESAGTEDLLWLVGPDNPVDRNYSPPDTTNIAGSVKSTMGTMLLESRAAAACIEMVAAMNAAGIRDISACSGYRSYSKQQSLHSNKIAQFREMGYSDAQARSRAARIVLPAGQSEHQTGLAIDFTTSSIGGALDNRFATTSAGKWLIEHAHEFGFILRYQSDKTEITRVTYEPWHYRYVGNPHATIMKEYDLSFEEYLSYLKEVEVFQYQLADGSTHEVRYSGDARSFGKKADMSSDNDGGYVVSRYLPQDPLVSGRTIMFDYELRQLILSCGLDAALLLPERPLYIALKAAYDAGFSESWSDAFAAAAPSSQADAAKKVINTLAGHEADWFAITTAL